LKFERGESAKFFFFGGLAVSFSLLVNLLVGFLRVCENDEAREGRVRAQRSVRERSREREPRQGKRESSSSPLFPFLSFYPSLSLSLSLSLPGDCRGLSNVAGRNRKKMTTTHGGHVYYVIKVLKDTEGNER